MSATTFTKTGSKASVAATLPKEIFELEVTNHELIKAAYVAYMANGRTNLAKTKTRGDVSGGGRKPWKQKGTGRARFGSSRVPIWRGGGITFGPTGSENYRHNITTGSKRLALRQALSLKNQAGNLIVLESLEIKDGKTKTFVDLMAKLGVTRTALLITDLLDENMVKASRNISTVKVIRPRAASVFDVMNADKVVVTTKSLEEIADWLTTKKGASK